MFNSTNARIFGISTYIPFNFVIDIDDKNIESTPKNINVNLIIASNPSEIVRLNNENVTPVIELEPDNVPSLENFSHHGSTFLVEVIIFSTMTTLTKIALQMPRGANLDLKEGEFKKPQTKIPLF